jgi:hypothetical protein
MKKLLFIPVILLLTLFLWNCEKDDICDANTPTTPRLVIQFYDKTDPTVLKNVTNLSITGVGVTDPIGNFNAVNTVSIPLKTTDDVTGYTFTLNSTDTTFINQDNIELHYTRNNVYISRACGYKTLFTLDPVTPIIHTDAATPDGLWIQSITVNQPNIQNEDETHVNIYF